MFDVKCFSTLDEEWEDRDAQLTEAAGSKGRAMYTASTGGGKTVDHSWTVRSFKEAQALKRDLEAVGGVRVTIREAISS